MMNIELFKTLNILYVENDEELKKTFSQILIKLFKKVFTSTFKIIKRKKSM